MVCFYLKGSAKAMEGHSVGKMFQELKDDGFKVVSNIQDGDASAKKSVLVKLLSKF